jgi:hypothetical protein
MKQRMHVRSRKTPSGVKKFVVNRGNVKKSSKRCVSKKKNDKSYVGDDLAWDLEGYNAKDNNEYWNDFYEDKKKKVRSVKDIMGEDEKD